MFKIFKSKINYTSEQIINNIIRKQNYSDTIKFIYQDNFDKILRMIIKMGGCEADAEDIFQDSLSKLIMSIETSQFKGRANISTYLYSICRNAWINMQKKQNKYSFFDESADHLLEDYDLIDEIPFIEEDQKTVKKFSEAFKSIGTDCRNLLKKLYFDLMSYEMLLTTHKDKYSSEQAIRNKKSRCIKYLRKSLGDDKDLSKEDMINMIGPCLDKEE
ncbi:sigma-70 family RNA polymerase sigma factor [Flammeovirga sp. SubArs3]|uniref:RNA polymerase sigma factor n=1 Tax=Flammeovirga sp. SubArs3 TaxID=2995316 RepID=UPI00248B1E83|nr:sigma-70 family RNA polymerase sigma factor [Flammeovirga sp. SubArs3]